MLAWIRSRFSYRLTFLIALTFLVLIALNGFVLSRILRAQLLSDLTSNLQKQAHLIAASLDATPFSPNRDLYDRIRDYGDACGCRVTLIRPDGDVLMDSGVSFDDHPSIESHGFRPEFVRALAHGKGTDVRLSRTVGVELLYAAIAVSPAPGAPVGVVRVALSLGEVHQRVRTLTDAIQAVMLFMMFGALVVVAILARSVSRPLRDMSEAARRLSLGDYRARVRELPPDEMGRLGETLNELADRLRTTFEALNNEKNQLSAILGNMVEAVVAVDSGGRVLAINRAFSRIFEVDAAEAMGRPFLEVLRNRRLEELLMKTLEDQSSRTEEIAVTTPETRVFETHAIPLPAEGAGAGGLIVMHDITHIRRLENVRRDFVANVSHELRTPLAAIRGFAETLLSGALSDRKNREDFVRTIQRQADRMIELVEDLLTLSAIESDQGRPNEDSVAVTQIVEEIVGDLRPLAEKKKVVLAVEIAEALPLVKADRTGLKQVVTNLLDNAVKFTPEGGRVTVAASLESPFVQLRVIDTGIGISAEDRERIFERFYRVDKARSREMGGTGLGLSIVKHIVEAAGGRVTLESEEGRGSSFSAFFPISK